MITSIVYSIFSLIIFGLIVSGSMMLFYAIKDAKQRKFEVIRYNFIRNNIQTFGLDD